MLLLGSDSEAAATDNNMLTVSSLTATLPPIITVSKQQQHNVHFVQ